MKIWVKKEEGKDENTFSPAQVMDQLQKVPSSLKWGGRQRWTELNDVVELQYLILRENENK